MTQLKQIYKCSICGNIVEVLHPGQGQLVCCGQPMELQIERSQDEGKEKHVPVIEKIENGIKVKIGSIPHPMEQEHFIEWVEIITGDKSYRKFLKPDDSPEAEFLLRAEIADISARIFCNIHGLWKN